MKKLASSVRSVCLISILFIVVPLVLVFFAVANNTIGKIKKKYGDKGQPCPTPFDILKKTREKSPPPKVKSWIRHWTGPYLYF